MAKKIDVNGLDHYHDKVSAMLASEYSSSKTYAVGDYCFHAGTLYECTTAITTAENWTAGHWTAAKLAEDTSALKTAINRYYRPCVYVKVYTNRYQCDMEYGAKPFLVEDPYSMFDYAVLGFSDAARQTQVSTTGWINDVKPFVPVDMTLYYRILFKKRDGSTISESDLEKIKISEGIIIYDGFTDIESKYDFILDDSIVNAESGIQTFYGFADFQSYNLSNTGQYDKTSTNRVSSVDPISFVRDITVSVANGFRWGFYSWVSGTGTWSGWKTADYTISANTSFTVIIARVTEVATEKADVLEFLSKVTFKTRYTAAINKTAKQKQIGTFLDVTHMGGYYNGNKGEDRLEAIEYNCKIGGFRAMEIDVRFTSDDIPVMCHLDENSAELGLFTDSQGNPVAVTISENTFDQLQTYNYLGTKVAKLEDGIKVCKKYGIDIVFDKVLYFTSSHLALIENMVASYGLEDNIYWLGPTIETAQSILTWYPKSKIMFMTDTTNWLNDNSWTSTFANYPHASFYATFEQSSITDSNIADVYAVKPSFMKIGLYTIDNIVTYEKRFYQTAFIISNMLRANDMIDNMI